MSYFDNYHSSILRLQPLALHLECVDLREQKTWTVTIEFEPWCWEETCCEGSLGRGRAGAITMFSVIDSDQFRCSVAWNIIASWNARNSDHTCASSHQSVIRGDPQATRTAYEVKRDLRRTTMIEPQPASIESASARENIPSGSRRG